MKIKFFYQTSVVALMAFTLTPEPVMASIELTLARSKIVTNDKATVLAFKSHSEWIVEYRSKIMPSYPNITPEQYIQDKLKGLSATQIIAAYVKNQSALITLPRDDNNDNHDNKKSIIGDQPNLGNQPPQNQQGPNNPSTSDAKLTPQQLLTQKQLRDDMNVVENDPRILLRIPYMSNFFDGYKEIKSKYPSCTGDLYFKLRNKGFSLDDIKYLCEENNDLNAILELRDSQTPKDIIEALKLSKAKILSPQKSDQPNLDNQPPQSQQGPNNNPAVNNPKPLPAPSPQPGQQPKATTENPPSIGFNNRTWDLEYQLLFRKNNKLTTDYFLKLREAGFEADQIGYLFDKHVPLDKLLFSRNEGESPAAIYGQIRQSINNESNSGSSSPNSPLSSSKNSPSSPADNDDEELDQGSNLSHSGHSSSSSLGSSSSKNTPSSSSSKSKSSDSEASNLNLEEEQEKKEAEQVKQLKKIEEALLTQVDPQIRSATIAAFQKNRGLIDRYTRIHTTYPKLRPDQYIELIDRKLTDDQISTLAYHEVNFDRFLSEISAAELLKLINENSDYTLGPSINNALKKKDEEKVKHQEDNQAQQEKDQERMVQQQAEQQRLAKTGVTITDDVKLDDYIRVNPQLRDEYSKVKSSIPNFSFDDFAALIYLHFDSDEIVSIYQAGFTPMDAVNAFRKELSIDEFMTQVTNKLARDKTKQEKVDGEAEKAPSALKKLEDMTADERKALTLDQKKDETKKYLANSSFSFYRKEQNAVIKNETENAVEYLLFGGFNNSSIIVEPNENQIVATRSLMTPSDLGPAIEKPNKEAIDAVISSTNIDKNIKKAVTWSIQNNFTSKGLGIVPQAVARCIQSNVGTDLPRFQIVWNKAGQILSAGLDANDRIDSKSSQFVSDGKDESLKNIRVGSYVVFSDLRASSDVTVTIVNGAVVPTEIVKRN